MSSKDSDSQSVGSSGSSSNSGFIIVDNNIKKKLPAVKADLHEDFEISISSFVHLNVEDDLERDFGIKFSNDTGYGNSIKDIPDNLDQDSRNHSECPESGNNNENYDTEHNTSKQYLETDFGDISDYRKSVSEYSSKDDFDRTIGDSTEPLGNTSEYRYSTIRCLETRSSRKKAIVIEDISSYSGHGNTTTAEHTKGQEADKCKGNCSNR